MNHIKQHGVAKTHVRGATHLQLPRGITGFDASTSVNVRDFRTVLYDAARAIGFTVDAEPTEAAENYHTFVRAFVSHRRERWRLLLNVYHPYVAFTTPETDLGNFNFHFKDCDRLARRLVGYTVLPADLLGSPVDEHAIALLSESEHKEIKYWSPPTLGLLIFNFWD